MKVEQAGGTADEELVSALVALHDHVVADFDAETQDGGALNDALGRVAALAEEAQHLGLADIAVRLAEHAGSAPEPESLRERLAGFVMAAADYVAQPAAWETQQALLACVDSLVSADETDILRLMLGMTPDLVPTVMEGDAPLQSVDAAVLQGLQREAEPLLKEFARMAAQMTVGELLAEELEPLGRGAAFAGLTALAEALAAAGKALTADTLDRDAFAPAISAYLADPADSESAMRLAVLVAGEEGEALARSLAAVQVTQAAASEPARAVTATAEDVSLELPADINPELLDGLLLELPVQTSAFSQAVQRIVEGRATREDLEIAKRAAHTLKGAANTVGVRGIAMLTHTLEDILVALSEHGVLPNLGLAQTLGYAADCLEAMSEALTGAGVPPADALNVLQDVLNWANRIDRQGIGAARGEAAAEPAAEGEGVAVRKPDHDASAMLRVPASLVDELLRLVGETMTTSAQIQNRINLAMAQARTINRQNTLLQQLVGELETMVDLRGLGLTGKAGAASPVAAEFDALEFEHYNELQTLSRQLAEVAVDAREMGLAAEDHLAALSELQEEQLRLQLESQQAVMGTRMVPVSSVFSRLQRGVRQACRILDKEAELELRGENTVMDGNVLHDLIDALMHLLRNAVDHGIESAGEREAAGKPEAGRIELEFRREGDYIAVRCADDGRGLDLDAIRVHAEEHGIIEPGAELTEEEVARLILIPGFSTRDETTQVSGRGIGMDAVNARVLALKGTLHLTSRRGFGMTVELRLPVTLLSTHALLARVRDKVVALSTRGIEEIHFVPAQEAGQVAEGLFALTGEHHVIAELDAVLGLPGDRRARGRHGWPVLMVRLESGARRAVMVQEMIETRSVVMKPLGPYVPKIRGVVGATILGDGSVAPVIDLPELLHVERAQAAAARGADAVAAEAGGGLGRVLVVDDSISARRALVQTVRDAGYEVRAAADGLEAIGILEQRVPDVIITDMEMPRMNGFELAQHVRAREATRHLPVIMVTSRSTEKHRRQAELAGVDSYLTKPFNDRELLEQLEALMARGTPQRRATGA